MMTPEQGIAIAATSVVGLLGFFLRSAFATITTRLDRLEAGLVELIAEMRANNVIGNTNASEIAILRQRYHELSNELQSHKFIIDKCKQCQGK
jgi:hypothetical protein